MRILALVLGSSAALISWLTLALGGIQTATLGIHAELAFFGLMVETAAMLFGAALCVSIPRPAALLLIVGSLGFAISAAIVPGTSLIIQTVPAALGSIASILAYTSTVQRAPDRDRPRNYRKRPGNPGTRRAAAATRMEPQLGYERALAPPTYRPKGRGYRDNRRRSSSKGAVSLLIFIVLAGIGVAISIGAIGPGGLTTAPTDKRPAPAAAPSSALAASSSNDVDAPSKEAPRLAAEGAPPTDGASAQPLPPAQVALAAYRSGDKATAVKIWTSLSQAGDADAQVNLANAYRSGDGLPQDDAKAAIWYRKAADQGVAVAQTALASLYYLGSGVDKDYGQALILFEQAADQNDPLAQFALGQMYYYGQATAPDSVAAWMWLELAAESGEQEAIKFGTDVSAAMTPQQINQAKKLVNAWHAAHPQAKTEPKAAG